MMARYFGGYLMVRFFRSASAIRWQGDSECGEIADVYCHNAIPDTELSASDSRQPRGGFRLPQ